MIEQMRGPSATEDNTMNEMVTDEQQATGDEMEVPSTKQPTETAAEVAAGNTTKGASPKIDEEPRVPMGAFQLQYP